MRFRATVLLGGKTATGIPVPDEVVAGLGSSKRPAVRITIAGHSYRSTVARMGQEFMLPLSAENRTSAGVAAGDEVDVDIELDTEPREVTVPPDFAAELDREHRRETLLRRAVVQPAAVARDVHRRSQDRRDAAATHRQVDWHAAGGTRSLR